MDEVLELLDKTAKRIQKALDESKEAASKQTTAYEKMLKSKEASEKQRIRAFIGKTLELDRLEQLSSQLSLVDAVYAYVVQAN